MLSEGFILFHTNKKISYTDFVSGDLGHFYEGDM